MREDRDEACGEEVLGEEGWDVGFRAGEGVGVGAEGRWEEREGCEGVFWRWRESLSCWVGSLGICWVAVAVHVRRG
jgi:hypothetical protein